MSNFVAPSTPFIPVRGTVEQWLEEKITDATMKVRAFRERLSEIEDRGGAADVSSFAFEDASNVVLASCAARAYKRFLNVLTSGAEQIPTEKAAQARFMKDYATHLLVNMVGGREHSSADPMRLLAKTGERHAYAEMIGVANYMLTVDDVAKAC